MYGRRRFEEIVDECIERVARGEPLDEVLLAYPQHGPELLPLLRAASTMLGARARVASPGASHAALQRMTAALDGARATGAPATPGFAWLTSFRSRPSAYQGAALAGALIFFGALGLGGAAATGNAPEPVRAFFGVSSTSVIKVEFEGTITSVLGDTLTVDAAGDLRTVRVTTDTEISDGDASDLQVGVVIEVDGTLLPDNTIAARQIEIEDDDCEDADDGHDDGDDHDNSGPGGGDDDGDDDDDDGDDDDADNVCATTTPQATPTAGTVATATPDVDDDDDDGEDDDDTDNSGPGGDDIDNSDPGGGDDGSDD